GVRIVHVAGAHGDDMTELDQTSGEGPAHLTGAEDSDIHGAILCPIARPWESMPQLSLRSASVADMAIRTANARWEGTFSDGTGIMRTGKGGLEANFSAKSRFEEGEGSNPEELIGAAHAGCVSD